MENIFVVSMFFVIGFLIVAPFLVFGYFKRKLRSSRLQTLAVEFGLLYNEGISPLRYSLKYPLLEPSFYECNIIKGTISAKRIRIYDHYRGTRANYAISRGLMKFIDIGGPWSRGTRIYIDEHPYRIKTKIPCTFASVKSIRSALNNLKGEKPYNTFLKAL